METIEKYASVAEFNAKNFNKRHIFILNHRNNNPSITQYANNKPTGLANYFPIQVSMPMEDEIFDIEKRQMRLIRYAPGEQSIYKDEQPKEDITRPFVPQRMAFTRGELIVEARETKKLEFLQKSDWNGSNPNRNPDKPIKFFAVDVAKSIKEEINKDKAKQKAVSWCYEAASEDIIAFARILNFDLTKEIEELRWALKLQAERDPEKFFKAINNPATNRKSVILNAIERGILKVNSSTNSVHWSGGNVILIAPIGKDPVEFLVDSTFKGEENERVYAMIYSSVEAKRSPSSESVVAPTPQGVNKDFVLKRPPVVVDRKNPKGKPEKTPDDLMIENAVSKGVLSQKKLWYFYGDTKMQGKKAVLAKMKEDSAMAEAIQNA